MPPASPALAPTHTTTSSSNMSEGATPAEQLLECARRNNTELFSEISAQLGDGPALGDLINSTTETVSGNGPLHITTLIGNWEVLDMMLDVAGVEIDPTNREHATPLHLAVKYAADEPEHGYFIVDNLLDAGSDSRAPDIHGLRPANYVCNNPELLELLKSAEYAAGMAAVPAAADDEEDGSASDSE